MAEFTLKQFENLNLYSNDSLQKVISSLVNTSSNAVLINMFEDSLILLDHEEGQFYIADYNFDPKVLRLKIENFEPVELKHETDEFKEKIYEFFDDEDGSAIDLADSYKEHVLDQERYINDLINESMSTKDFSEVIDYSKIKNLIDEDAIEELRKEKFFESYEKRLSTHPLTEIKMFDWKRPIEVSLVETEARKIVNATAVEKATDLWKRADFKEAFEDASETLIEDVEEGTEKFKSLLEDFPQIFYLDSADRKTLFGKTILSSKKEVREEMSILLKGIDLLFEQFDLSEMKESYLAEAGEEDDISGEEDTSKEDGEKEDGEKEDKAPEVEPIDMKKISSELKKIAEKVEDEDIKNKLEKLIERIGKGEEEGTRPDVVKEAISILTL